MSNIKKSYPPNDAVYPEAFVREQAAPFVLTGEGKVQASFTITFAFGGGLQDLIDAINRDNALHVPIEEIKGITVREKSRTELRNMKFCKRS